MKTPWVVGDAELLHWRDEGGSWKAKPSSGTVASADDPISCDLDRLTTSEAAEILGVADVTVKAQISRARAELRRHFATNS